MNSLLNSSSVMTLAIQYGEYHSWPQLFLFESLLRTLEDRKIAIWQYHQRIIGAATLETDYVKVITGLIINLQ